MTRLHNNGAPGPRVPIRPPPPEPSPLRQALLRESSRLLSFVLWSALALACVVKMQVKFPKSPPRSPSLCSIRDLIPPFCSDALKCICIVDRLPGAPSTLGISLSLSLFPSAFPPPPSICLLASPTLLTFFSVSPFAFRPFSQFPYSHSSFFSFFCTCASKLKMDLNG